VKLAAQSYRIRAVRTSSCQALTKATPFLSGFLRISAVRSSFCIASSTTKPASVILTRPDGHEDVEPRGWALFGVPPRLTVFSAIGLGLVWKAETQRALLALAISFPPAAALTICCAFAYFWMGGNVDGISVAEIGFLLSLPGVGLGFYVALTFHRWFSALAFTVSIWTLFLCRLMMSARYECRSNRAAQAKVSPRPFRCLQFLSETDINAIRGVH
jgi:hypothetical protein